MKRILGTLVAAGVLAILAAVPFLSSGPSPAGAARAAEAGDAATRDAATRDEAAGDEAAGTPVEPDMHEFMEYVFQPTYKRLKSQMASEPTDNQGWKAIKADALTLAEGGNLLLIRQPEDDRKDWTRQSLQVRDLGGQLYRAAGAKDFKTARQRYEAMLTNCNACHQQFAGGEYQLKP